MNYDVIEAAAGLADTLDKLRDRFGWDVVSEMIEVTEEVRRHPWREAVEQFREVAPDIRQTWRLGIRAILDNNQQGETYD
jgi:hypothetical protein